MQSSYAEKKSITNPDNGYNNSLASFAKILTVNSPNGGEIWQAGTQKLVSWNSNEVEFIRVEYTVNNGASWNVVRNSIAANEGNLIWTIPSTLSSALAKIRIYDISDPSVGDSSDNVFTIKRLDVTSPTLSQRFQIGTFRSINWIASNTIDTVKIEYSTNNGLTWQLISGSTPASTGTYNWFVPNTTTTSQALIRLTDITDPSLVGTSAQFSIVSVQLTSPVGGENWFGGSNRTITWQSNNINKVKLEYSTNNGTNWFTITDSTNASSGSYSWTVASAPTAQALVRVSDASSASVLSVSDNVFTISALSVSSPNGGEGLQIDSVRQITWATNLSSNIRIDLSTDNGLTWPIVLKDSIPANQLSFSFTVPNNPTSTARVRLISLTDATVLDISDAPFTIGNVLITSPIGGNYQAGSSLQIDWTSTEGITTARIDYSLDNGATWNSIIASTPSSHIGTNTYNWNIPSNISSDFARIRVSDAATGTAISRISQSFSISRLEITTNFANQVYLAGSNVTINWVASSNITNVALEYSGDNGSTWDPIPGGIVPATDLSYVWTTPSDLSLPQGRIRLIAQNNNSIIAVSQNVFRVGIVSLTYPNATGIRLLGSQQVNITWTNSSSVSLVRLEYTLDNGTSWNLITAATNAAQNSYSWTVPTSAANGTARVRIRDSFSPILIDESDHNFTIVTLTLTSPASRIGIISGSTQAVTWNSSGITAINIQFSANSGGSWTDLDTNINAALGTKNITIPSNIITDQGKIRIVEKGNPDFTSTHNGELRVDKISIQDIVPSVLQVDSSYSIQWDPTTVIQNVRIELSTDNGGTWPITITPSTSAAAQSFTWNTSNNPSVTAKFRVSDADFPGISNVSTTAFSIKRLTLLSPNGGEFLQVGATHSITWDRSNNINNVKLEYSTNSGAEWSTIIASTPANTGSYDWIIPDNFTINGLVRITDIASTNIIDRSDARFTISSLKLNAPNGGEIYSVNSNQLIQWQTHPTIANVRIELSVDNGQTFPHVITASTPAIAGSYSWTVNNLPGANVKIRISDVARDFIADTSDASFTIRSLRIISPNGGGKLQAGKIDTIRWSSINTVTNVKIEYSTNDGTSWIQLDSSKLASAGEYIYTVPNTPTNFARVRVSSTVDSSIQDMSDNTFNISSLQLLSPNGGENLFSGSIHKIQWSSSQIANVKIDYLPDGVTPQTIVASVAASTGEFNWTVPAFATNTGIIRIYDASYEQTTDASDAPFNVITMNLTSPIGGEGWRIGTTKNITWTSSGIANVRLEYSTNNGSVWHSIVNSVPANTGTYAWLIPDSASNRARVRIVNIADPTVIISSPNPFTLGTITLNNLKGGNQIQANSDTTITWTSKGFDNVRIEYASDGVNFNQVITASTSASLGTYNWTVPAVATTNGRLRISDAATNLGLVDSSTSVFTISSLSLTAPNGGDVWQSGSNNNITWSSSAVSNVKLDYSTDNGTTWVTITNSTPSVAGSFSWNTKDNSNSLLSTAQALIRISDAANSNISSRSNSTFKIGWLQITSPTAGLVFQGGTTKTITWNSSSSIANVVLEYSTDGLSWSNIVSSVNAATGTYQWLVPNNISSTTVRVRVKDALSDNISSVSQLFTITQLSITSPNGGETWQAGTVKNITWNNSASTLNVKLEYSTGSTWHQIVASTPAAAGTFAWSIPSDSASNTVKIRITDVNNNTLTDTSDASFSIARLKLNTPLLTDHYQAGNDTVITWTSSFIDNLKLELSTNGGTSWSTISASTLASTQKYNWTIDTSLASSLMKIRISSVNDATISDSSQIFKITKLRIISPNGGEQLQAGSTRAVTWSSGNVTNLKLEYTTNDGTSWNNIVVSTPAATGTFNWNIPQNISSTTARIRVSDVSNSIIKDLSDNTFNISNLILTSPVGGEQLQFGKTSPITWTSNSIVGNVKIEVSSNAGVNWQTIVASVPAANGTFNWTVSGFVPSNQMRIKITSVSTPTLTTESADFTVSSLALTSPVGGEFWQAGTVKNITWTSSVINNVNLYFSTDNGANWNIMTTVPAITGTFNWNIPANLASSDMKIKIADAAKNSIADSSALKFKIGTVQLTSPNGGEIWQAGTSKNITWTNSVNITSVRLDYSTNNGTTWIPISLSVPATSTPYAWSIPDSISSSSALVRVSDAFSNLQLIDESDLSFTISSLRVISPNGGEIVQAGTNQQISWSAGGGINFVKIEFSDDNGTSWNLIDNNIPVASSPYTWAIPSNISTTNGLIRISNVADPTVFGVSNAVFKIGNIVVTSPNGGERWQAGSPKTITWNASSSISQVNITYSTDNGVTFQRTISSNVNAALGTFSWLIDTTISNQVFVKIADAQVNSTIADQNDVVFTISNLRSLTPLTSENVLSGSAYTIRWSNSSDVTAINLHYTTNGGNTWVLIANAVNPASGQYAWTVPSNVSTNNARIRIQDNSDITIQSFSGIFTIYSPTITLLTPNGNEFVNSGSNRLITWTSSQIGNVSLEYSLDNGTTWTTITSSYPADSARFIWAVGQNLSATQARIRISDAINPLVINDMSDGAFKIGSVMVTLPNGGENYLAGTTRNITWQTSNSVTAVRIDYSTNNGGVWIPITNSVSSLPASYSWAVPNTPSVSARVRISDAASSLAISDTSDLPFSITALRITSPNGGEELQSGKTHSITWSASNSIESVSLEYSLDNGLVWNSIIPSTPAINGTFNWGITESFSTSQALLRITDVSNPSVSDMSDAVFSIKRLRLTAPNGGEFLQVGTTQPITWISGSNIANVKLEYSSDGTNWNFISNVVASNQTYNWIIPSISSSTLRIRVSDLSNTTISDNSDGLFKVGSIAVISPNGGEDLQAGTTQNIIWNNSASIAKVTIQYSTNDGAVWLPVVDELNANTNSYVWTVPNTVTTQARVRVYDSESNFNIKDSSDATFTISNLVILTPIAGSSWSAGTSQNITWTNSSNIANVDLSYSTNGGSSWNVIASNVLSSPASYSWNIPINLNSTNSKIRIQNSANTAIESISGTFTIFYPALTLLSPNGGEYIQAGVSFPITWNSSLITNVKLEYSTNNGLNWNTIVEPTSAVSGSYNWTVPSNLSSNLMLVRISDQQNGAVTDISDLPFNVGSVTLVSPSSGDRLLAGAITTINWTMSSSVLAVKVDYSSDNGTTWNVVTPSTIGTSIPWVVPSTTTSQARIRISDAVSNLSIANINSNPFTISSLNVISPNGGEYLHAGTTFPITWSSSIVNNISLQYSTNNGTTWLDVVGGTNISAATGSFNWNVPVNLDATTGRIRIADVLAPNIADTSDGTFVIGFVNLSYPNGDNIIQAGSIDTIRWERSNSVTQLRIDYSTNNGTTWSNIVASTNASTLAYQWNVPSIPTSNALIRISDAASNLRIKDSSDAVFTINSLQVLTPNGNEEYLAGNQTNIQWNSSSNITLLNLDLLENDVFKQSIATNVDASLGSFTWSIPASLFSNGKNFKVRISNASNSNVFDLSDSNFTVKRIVIQSPITADNWQANTTNVIRWNTNNISKVNIDYSTNNGTTWTRIFDTLSTSSSDNSVNWLVPNVTSSQARVRIIDASNSAINFSSGQFTIYKPSLTILTPNGGEVWQAGRSRTIAWSSSLVDSIRLEYSTDNGTTWNLINNNIDGSVGTFNWQIPDTISSSSALIRATNLTSTFISDISDNPFTISRLDLLSPNGGETWQAGTTKAITWFSSSNITNLKVEFSSNSGTNWNQISIVNAASGTTNWTIPSGFASSNMKIRISDASNLSINDSSTNDFRISWIEVVTPNGGENLQAGKSTTIRWNYSTNIQTVRLEYSLQSGTPWLAIAGGSGLPAGDQQFVWTVPDGIFSSSAKIRVIDGASDEILDSSNAVFNIRYLKILSPVTGDNLASGSTQSIRWASGNINTLKIEYSLDNGNTWNIIGINHPASDSSIQWNIPNTAVSPFSRVRISNAVDPTIVDTTGIFNIYIPGIILNSPNGGEFLTSGSSVQINWSSSFIDNIKIEFSSDNGQAWNSIIASIPASVGTYTWNIPNNLSTAQGRIKITDIANSSFVDSSESTFKIGWVRVLTPNGGENWLAGTQRTISWTNSASVSNVNIEYTIDSIWIPIASNIVTSSPLTQSYTWTVPNLETSTGRVRVSDAASSTALGDISDNNFIISRIELLVPNGGQVWRAGNTEQITWTRSTNIANIRIDLSKNENGVYSLQTLAPQVDASLGSWDWAINIGESSDNCRIVISDVSNSAILDSSEGTFKISAMRLLAPVEAIKILENSVYNIQWESSSNVSKIDIHYTTNNGASWVPIILNYSASVRNFNWTVPESPSDSCRIRIRNNQNISFVDQSANVFSISRMKLTVPNGSQKWQLGTSKEITFETKFVSNVRIELNRDGSNTWDPLVDSHPTASGKYTWLLPNSLALAGPNNRIRIVDADYPNVADTSDEIFTLAYLQLLTPNGGVGSQIGSNFEITWESSQITAVGLEYSTNNGATWKVIKNIVDASLKKYDWDIPNEASNNCIVQIYDYQKREIADQSDSTFTISYIALTNNYGVNKARVQVGKSYPISWNSGFVNNVKIEYSTNNGSDWNEILEAISIPAANSVFHWTIPNFPTRSALIRIIDTQHPQIVDTSNNLLTISTIKLLSPNDLTAYQIGTTKEISWAVENIDSVLIQLSTDDGVTWPTNLSSKPSLPSTFSWLIPNIRTSKARIRITDKNDLSIEDASDTNFVIGTFPRLTVNRDFQKDTISISYTFETPGERLEIVKAEYILNNAAPIEITGSLVGDYSQITGPTSGTILWNSLNNLDFVEAKVTVNITFNSPVFNVQYPVSIDSVGVDNKAPVFNPITIQAMQNPYLFGWDKAMLTWLAATDTNKPIQYKITVTDASNNVTLPTITRFSDSVIVNGLSTSTNYTVSLVVQDALGNDTSFTKQIKTQAAVDFNNDGRIDAVDLAAFVQAWSKSDSSSGVDLYPFIGDIPHIRVIGNGILNVEDLMIFVDMWNYYQDFNGLPKQQASQMTDSKIDRQTIKFRKGENLVSLPIEFDSTLGLTAFSSQIYYNTESFVFDSVGVGSLNELSMSDISLIHRDSVNGRVNIDFANLSGEIKNNYFIDSKISYNFDRATKRDSVLIVVNGYDKNLKNVYTKQTVYTLQEIPNSYSLYQNYPNPFNPITTIEFDVPEKSFVNLTIYDILGRRVTTLVNEEKNEGTHRIQLDMNRVANGLASGVYLYRLQSGKFNVTKKMVLIK
jgi:hypothetical protein